MNGPAMLTPSRSRQATVAAFDPDTGAGAVLHDDGGWREEFSAAAFQAGGLRFLRVGQRVRLDYARSEVPVGGEASDEVRRVTLITLP